MRKALPLTVLVLLLANAASGFAYQDRAEPAPAAEAQPSPRNFDSGNETQAIISRIDENLVRSYIQPLQDFGTRYAYTPTCWDSSEYIASVMRGSGLAVTYDELVYGEYKVRNIVGELPGTDPNSTEIYIICAHYDSYSNERYYSAPGADDDASGVAALLIAVQLLSHYSFSHTIRFIGFGAEEQGLIGSDDYARRLNESGAKIGGVLNLDMVGFNIDDTTVSMYTDYQSEWLSNYTLNSTANYSGNRISPNKIIDPSETYSDHASFWTWGYPALMFIETTFSPWYHKTTDTNDRLNLTYAANVTQIAVSTLCDLAQMDAGDSVGPSFSRALPSPGGWGNETPVISVRVTDPSGINETSVRLYVDGYRVLCGFSQAPLGLDISYWHEGGFADGKLVRCRLIASDMRGNPVDYRWNFTVDGVSPAPPSGLSIGLTKLLGTKQGVVLNPGPEPFDGWLVERPYVMFKDGEYKMWYGGDNGYNSYRICYANSTDGVNWTKRGIVLDLGNWWDNDSHQTSRCSILWEGEYKMWYSGNNGSAWRIMYANSTDGLNWTKRGVVLDLGSASAPDSWSLYGPSVLRDGATYKMWYTAWNGIVKRIMYAESPDGYNWTRMGVNIDYGPSGSLSSMGVADPFVVRSAEGYVMWYAGSDGVGWRTLSAVSEDGMSWSERGISVELGDVWAEDSARAESPGVLIHNGTTSIYYTGQGSDQRRRIMLATINLSTVKSDVVVSWNLSASPDVEGYEVRASESLTDLENGGGRYYTSAGKSLVIIGAGDDNLTAMYLKVASVDKVGHRVERWQALAKVGYQFTSGWAILGSPFSPAGVTMASSLATIDWNYTLSYVASDPSDHWKTNSTERPDYLDDLTRLDSMQGLWVQANSSSVYVTMGVLANSTVRLRAGWNLVAMPYATNRTVSAVRAAIGSSCGIVEGFAPLEKNMLRALSPGDWMRPGEAYWIQMTADADWMVQNY